MEELLLAVKQRGGARGSGCGRGLGLHLFRFGRSLDGSRVAFRELVFLGAAPLLCRLSIWGHGGTRINQQ